MITTEGTTPFPYDQVSQDLDGPSDADAKDAAYAMASEFVGTYLRWLILGPDGKHAGVGRPPDFALAIAKRAIASAWVVDPSLLSGQSLRALAWKLHMSKSQLSMMAVAFGDQFGVHGRGQMPVSVRKAYARRPQSVAKRFRGKCRP